MLCAVCLQVIMTERQQQDRYLSISSGQEQIESQVMPKLCDMINSEIASGLIKNIGDLILWAQNVRSWPSCFLFVPIAPC